MTTAGSTHAPYPVRVEGHLDDHLSRWLWLVKWFLVIPHYIVLSFLWIAFAVVSVMAFFAIVFAGRYPRALFDFNVGVMRWTWRVSYYAYGALGTDRYPPFTLAEVADYPAHVEVEYPEHLSRGLVLVKWWLLAIPHYIIVAVFAGGWRYWGGGIIAALALVAALMLAFTATYPKQLFDVILGMNRWVLRVAAYAGLMTDEYPPFRLDMGGNDPAGRIVVQQPAVPVAHRWTAGRIVALVIGSFMVLVSLGVLAGGGAATWADRASRDDAGYVTSGLHTITSDQHAITAEGIDLQTDGPDWIYPSSIFGTVRIRVTPIAENAPVFVGIGPSDDVNAYLTGVGHAQLGGFTTEPRRIHQGGAPAAPPAERGFWTVSRSGIGEQTLTWRPERGSWSVVMMNADGSRDLAVRADVGATVPSLGAFGIGLLVGGGVILIAGGALIAGAAARASRGAQS